LEKLFFFYEGDKELRVSWNRDKIKEFQRAHGLEEVKIRSARYDKTLIGFFKTLFSEITGRGIRACGGFYLYSPKAITLFHDIIVSRAFNELEAESTIEKITQKVSEVLARTLAHEFGHAEEISRKTDSSLNIPLSWKMLIPFIGDRYVRQTKELIIEKRKAREDYAERFARRHAKELEGFIRIETIF
jgi:hypothetical protein